MSDFLQKIYDETFEAVYNELLNRKKTDKDFTVSDIEGLLDSYYANEGNNWVGQSEVRLTKQSATVAAYEKILFEW